MRHVDAEHVVERALDGGCLRRAHRSPARPQRDVERPLLAPLCDRTQVHPAREHRIRGQGARRGSARARHGGGQQRVGADRRALADRCRDRAPVERDRDRRSHALQVERRPARVDAQVRDVAARRRQEHGARRQRPGRARRAVEHRVGRAAGDRRDRRARAEAQTHLDAVGDASRPEHRRGELLVAHERQAPGARRGEPVGTGRVLRARHPRRSAGAACLRAAGRCRPRRRARASSDRSC